MFTARRIMKEITEIAGILLIVFTIRTMIFSLYKVPSGSMETTMLVGEYYFADKLSYWFRTPKRGEIIACNQPTYVYSTNPIVKKLEQYVSIPFIDWGPQNWTKRIIGLPGEHIKGVVEQGRAVIYINGERFDEPYVNAYPLVIERCSGNTKARLERSYDATKPFDKQPFYKINPSALIRRTDNNSIIMKMPGHALPSHLDSRIGTDQNYWNGSDEFNVHLGKDEYWIMGDNRLGSGDSRYFGPVKEDAFHARILWRLWSIDSNESWWFFELFKHPIDFWSKLRWNRFFSVVH